MLTRTVDGLGRTFLDFIAPACCHFCGAALARGAVCEPCKGSLPWNDRACDRCAAPVPTAGTCDECRAGPPPYSSAWAAFRYAPPIAGRIVGLKFHARFASAHILGRLMAEALARRPSPLPEILIPVPLHGERLIRRGYNQALEAARELERRLPLTLAPALASRRRATGEQTRLHAAARRRNVRGAFAVSEAVRGRHVAILDDVITTGATMAELAAEVRRQGAARIEAWAIARA